MLGKTSNEIYALLFLKGEKNVRKDVHNAHYQILQGFFSIYDIKRAVKFLNRSGDLLMASPIVTGMISVTFNNQFPM